jgi:polyisoprenoid-binding protein YceI
MATLQASALITVLGLFLQSSSAFAAVDEQGSVEIRGGTATFDAATNISVISIHGKSSALEGRARIRQSADGLVIEQLEAALPVRTLSTGMELRDEHMRKQVFTTPAGLVPDLRFVADRAVCAGSGRVTCELSGELIIRDTSRPFTIALKVNDNGDSFRAAGDVTVRLSTYGIAPPSQLGVTTKDEVKLHVDFTVKRVEEAVGTRGTRQQ